MCPENFKSFYRFAPRNGELNANKTCPATKGRGVLPRNLETHARKAWVAEIENHRNIP